MSNNTNKSRPPTEMMVVSRERRANAGARMNQLLNSEDCDDFYKSTYGGFYEEADDAEYESPVDEESDYVDSDFDIDEDEKSNADEETGENYDDDSEQKKKSTKAYKEPTLKKADSASTAPAPTEKPPKPKPTKSLAALKREYNIGEFGHVTEKELRASTRLKTEERRREPRRVRMYRRRKREPYAILTQAELLEETKETEEQNIKSLEKFYQFELEKRKRHRFGKERIVRGPFIRYLSTAMPLPNSLVEKAVASTEIADSAPVGSEKPVTATRSAAHKFYLGDERSNDGSASESTPSANADIDQQQYSRPESAMDAPTPNPITAIDSVPKTSRLQPKCSRTFITFSDEATFRQYVPNSRGQRKPMVPKAQFCVVTGLPAKYLDPLTRLPYANSDAFKAIREAYCKHVEEKGDKNDPAVADWLEYNRMKNQISGL